MTIPTPSSPPTLIDFQQAITPVYVKGLQVFYVALSIGVIVFFFVVFYFYIESTELKLGDSREMLDMLSIVHLVYAVLAYAVATLLFGRTLAKGRAGVGGPATAEGFLATYRLASVVRLAIFEGVAFFGLVVIFIGAQTGLLQISPQYWLNLFSTVILCGLVIWTFPTRDRIEETCRSLVQG
jgi:hypothetical protein